MATREQDSGKEEGEHFLVNGGNETDQVSSSERRVISALELGLTA